MFSVNAPCEILRQTRYHRPMGTITSLNQASEGTETPENLLASINTLIGEDMAAVDRHIQSELRSDVALIE